MDSPPSPDEESLLSIDRYLTEQASATLLSQSTRNALERGEAIELTGAFVRDFAEGLHAAIDATDTWTPVEDHGGEHVLYRHHRLYDPMALPGVQACHAVFDSAPTKRFIERATGRRCAAPIQFGVTRYLPGEYTLPIPDEPSRGVAFVWSLTRDWNRKWGGDLYFSEEWRCLEPTFNTLVLFLAAPRSQHFIAPVSPFATGKRMAVTGWWMR